SKYSTLHGAGGAVAPDELQSSDALIAFYEQEAKDVKLTAAERAHYASLAVAARKSLTAETQRDAQEYERVAIQQAKTDVENAKRLRGNIGAQEAALRTEIGTYLSASHNRHLSSEQRATYGTDAATARTELS